MKKLNVILGWMACLAMTLFVGCGAEGEQVDATGNVVGELNQSLERQPADANEVGRAGAADAEGRKCSTLCDCGRIWHSCAWTINCDYWCGKVDEKDGEAGNCGNDENRERANECIEREADADDERRPARQAPIAPAQRDEEAPAQRDEQNDEDAQAVRGADGCYSICGDPTDGVICGPHACTHEAVGSCCPQDDTRPERNEEDNQRGDVQDNNDQAGDAEPSDDAEVSPRRPAPTSPRIRARMSVDVTYDARRRACRVTLQAQATHNVFLRAPGASQYLLTAAADAVYRTRPTSYGWTRTFTVRAGIHTASLHGTRGRHINRRPLTAKRIVCGVSPRDEQGTVLRPSAKKNIIKSEKVKKGLKASLTLDAAK